MVQEWLGFEWQTMTGLLIILKRLIISINICRSRIGIEGNKLVIE
jgi:hypothetical protein